MSVLSESIFQKKKGLPANDIATEHPNKTLFHRLVVAADRKLRIGGNMFCIQLMFGGNCATKTKM